MSPFHPVPKPSSHEEQDLTNVWPEMQQGGMVTLNVNTGSYTATWIDAVILADMLLAAARKSAANIGVDAQTYSSVVDAAALMTQESIAKWT